MSSKIAGDDNFDSGVASRSWSDESSSRSEGVVYTNNLNYPITVSISAFASASGRTAILVVGGVSVWGSSAPSANDRSFVSAEVPSGTTYSLSMLGYAGSEWSELR